MARINPTDEGYEALLADGTTVGVWRSRAEARLGAQIAERRARRNRGRPDAPPKVQNAPQRAR